MIKREKERRTKQIEGGEKHIGKEHRGMIKTKT